MSTSNTPPPARKLQQAPLLSHHLFQKLFTPHLNPAIDFTVLGVSDNLQNSSPTMINSEQSKCENCTENCTEICRCWINLSLYLAAVQGKLSLSVYTGLRMSYTHPHLPDTCPCLLCCLCNTVNGTRKLPQLKIRAFECARTSSGLKWSLSCCSLHLFTEN